MEGFLFSFKTSLLIWIYICRTFYIAPDSFRIFYPDSSTKKPLISKMYRLLGFEQGNSHCCVLFLF